MQRETYDIIWFALEKTPGAINLTKRSEIFMAIENTVKSRNVTPSLAAKRLGLARPRMDDLLRGKLSSLESRTALTYRAGLTIKMTVNKSQVKVAA